MRATIQQDSDGILQKQSRSEKKSDVRLWLHLTEERLKLTDAAVFLVCNSYLGTVETFGVLIFGRLCMSTPKESMIPEWELVSNKIVTVSSGSNLWLRRIVTCDWDRISLKRGWSLQMRLSFWCVTLTWGLWRLWGCWFMILIWPSVYVHP